MAKIEAKLFYRSGASEGVVLESILQDVQRSCPSDFFTFKTILTDTPEGQELVEKYEITNLPSLVLPNSKISGSLTEDFIVAIISSILGETKAESNGGDIHLPITDMPRISLASAFLENTILSREESSIFLFLIKPKPEDFDIERLKKLRHDRKIFIMTNFSEKAYPEFGELNLHENVFVGHIIRDNIYMTSSLTVRKKRPFYSSYIRVKITDEIKGKWSPLLSDSINAIKAFYLPLFMTSAPLNHEGKIEDGQNRVIAKSREAIDQVKQQFNW